MMIMEVFRKTFKALALLFFVLGGWAGAEYMGATASEQTHELAMAIVTLLVSSLACYVISFAKEK